MKEEDHVKYPDITVKLSGTDGNVFLIIGKVKKAIKEHAGVREAELFRDQAFAQQSYDAVIQLVMRKVNVE